MVDLDKQFAAIADVSEEETAYDFVIDEDLRVIAVPERGVVLGVEGDKDVNRVRFRMNRHYRGTDLSGFNIRINYRSAEDEINYFPVTEKTVTDDAIYFVWLVGADTVEVKGTVYFVARFFTAEEDGTIIQEFNTTLGNACTLEGLAVDAQAEDKPVKDLLAQLEYDLKTYAAPFVEQVKTAKRDALDAIDTSKQGALNAVEKKGKGVLATIPEDYTNLNESVVQLKEDLDSLLADVNALHPLTITAFSVFPSLAEKGSTVSAQSFSYSVNRAGAAVTLEGAEVSGGTASRADVLTEDRLYTLRAVLGVAVQNKTAKISFVAPVYYGVGVEFEISAMTCKLQTSRSMSFTVSAGAGRYILIALPVALGVPTFKVGGFEGGFELVDMRELTNASGHAESYRLYRSTNAGLGSTTVSVT